MQKCVDPGGHSGVNTGSLKIQMQILPLTNVQKCVEPWGQSGVNTGSMMVHMPTLPYENMQKCVETSVQSELNTGSPKVQLFHVYEKSVSNLRDGLRVRSCADT